MYDPFTFWLVAFALVVLVMQGYALNDRLGRMQRTLDRMARQQGVDFGAALSNHVKELARDPARKIEAIKAHRDETGAGLAEAKQAVEDYIRTLPQ